MFVLRLWSGVEEKHAEYLLVANNNSIFFFDIRMHITHTDRQTDRRTDRRTHWLNINFRFYIPLYTGNGIVLIEISSHSRARATTSENRRKDEKQHEEKSSASKRLHRILTVHMQRDRQREKDDVAKNDFSRLCFSFFSFFIARSFGWVSNNAEKYDGRQIERISIQIQPTSFSFFFVVFVFSFVFLSLFAKFSLILNRQLIVSVMRRQLCRTPRTWLHDVEARALPSNWVYT